MRLTLVVAVAVTVLGASALGSASSSYVVPTTTLAAQTSDNTSAANSFTTQSNNNRGAGNISKVDVHTLLYPGATTKVYAHMVLWFGQPRHRWRDYRLVWAGQYHRPGHAVGYDGSGEPSWIHFLDHDRSGSHRVVFLLRLLPATGVSRRPAVHREHVLPFAGLHDDTGTTGGYKF